MFALLAIVCGSELSPLRALPTIRPEAACSASDFVRNLAQKAEDRAAMNLKHETGYISRPTSYAEFMHLVERNKVETINITLGALSEKTPTYALIYGRVGPAYCIWLMGSKGVLAQGRLPLLDKAKVDRLWVELGVDAWVNRGAPKRRTRGDDCATPEVLIARRSPKELESSYTALREIQAAILPIAVRTYLESATPGRLLVLPTAAIGTLPFAALPLGKGYLIDKFSFVVLPSIDILGLQTSAKNSALLPVIDFNAPAVRGDAPGLRSMVVAAPDLTGFKDVCWAPLPSAKVEGDYAAKKLAATILNGSKANFKAVNDTLIANQNSLQLIYFATHAVADGTNPADGSYLAVAGQYLTGRSIQKLSLGQSPLVIMSACQTALGKEFAGGMYGLADAWWYAGAGQTAMSLWDVSDSGTEALMKLFVDRLVQSASAENGRRYDGAEFALADAMRQLRKLNPDPAIWASFSLYGVPAGGGAAIVAAQVKAPMILQMPDDIAEPMPFNPPPLQPSTFPHTRLH